MSLAEIELAVHADDPRTALEAAVALWRGARQPELADLVTLLSSRCNAPALAARSTTSVAFQDVWLRAVARDRLVALAPALATLTRALPLGRGPFHVRYAAWHERIDALAGVIDPRVAEAFVSVLDQMPFAAESEMRLYEPLLAHLDRLGDVRQLGPLRALLGRTFPRAWMRDLVMRAVPPVVAALAAREPLPLAPAQTAALDRIFDRLGSRPARRSPLLEALDQAIAAEDWRTAIETALASWRTRRAPELADLVDALGSKLPTAPFPKASAPVFHEVWLVAVAADPIGNLGAALAALTRLLPLGNPERGRSHAELRYRYAPWLARLAALRPIEDPRIATALVDVLRTTPFTEIFVTEQTAYDPVLDLLEQLGDVRQLTELRAIAASPPAPRPWLRELQSTELRWLAESLAVQAVIPLSDAERSRMLALVAGLRGATTTATDDAALLALVHANPEDDGPREVLADRWLERGDPRGELVTLQLKDARGDASDADRKRARAIARKHEKTWLGALAVVTKNRCYERGFLDRFELAANAVASTETWEAALAEPALRTVRSIGKGNGNRKHFERFVAAITPARNR